MRLKLPDQINKQCGRGKNMKLNLGFKVQINNFLF